MFLCIHHRIGGNVKESIDISEDIFKHCHWVDCWIWGRVQLCGGVSYVKDGGVLGADGCSRREAPLTIGVDTRAVDEAEWWYNDVGGK